MSRHSTPPERHHPVRSSTRLLAIIVVVSLGATLMLPSPATAQSLSSNVDGRVTDAFGDPVAQATVSARKHVSGDLWQLHETHTDAQGAFRLAGLSSGTWNLTVTKDGFVSYSKELTTQPNTTLTHDVTLKALLVRAYTATVTDAENEQPVRGAVVTVIGSEGQEHEERSASTDANGTATVRLFAHYNEIRITRSGFEPFHDHVYQPSSDVTRSAALWPAPVQTVTIIGKVVDGDGNPVKAYIDLRSSEGHPEPMPLSESDDPATSKPASPRYFNRYNSTVTDDDGTFTMHTYAGDQVLTANRRGHLVSEVSLTLADGQSRQVTLTLEALPARSVTLSGVVTDDATGEPVPGAQISIQVPALGDHAWVQAGKDGTWNAHVRPGYTMVEVSRYWWHDDATYSVADEPAPAPERAEASASEDGDSSRGAIATSDDAIRAPEPSSDRYLPRTVTFTTSAGENHTLDTTLLKRPEPQTTVVGYVIDAATDTAVAGARVNFQNHETGEWGQATTDANGSYRFAVYGGWHTVRVWADGHLPAAENLDAPESGSLRLDLDVQPGHYVNEGWWDPSGRDDDCCWIAEDGMARAEGDSAMAAPTAAGSEKSSDDASFTSEGPQTLQGSGGGLGPYDPDAKGSRQDGTTESPMPGVALVVAALGVLAVVAGLRRRD